MLCVTIKSLQSMSPKEIIHMVKVNSVVGVAEYVGRKICGVLSFSECDNVFSVDRVVRIIKQDIQSWRPFEIEGTGVVFSKYTKKPKHCTSSNSKRVTRDPPKPKTTPKDANSLAEALAVAKKEIAEGLGLPENRVELLFKIIA